MRICFVSRRYWPAVSGMSVYAEQLLRELVALGHEPVLVAQYRGDPEGTAVYGGGPPPAQRVPAGVEVVAVESRGETQRPADFDGDVDQLVSTVSALHATKPFDVLHAQYAYPPGLAVLRAGRALGLPTVVSVQGGDGHWVGSCCPSHRAAMLAVLDGVDAVLIGSASFRDEVVDRLGVAPARFTLVGGATDPVRFCPTRALGLLRDPPVLLFHGRVDARKGVFDLLEALPLLTTPVRLVISGIGPDLDEVRRRSAALPAVTLTGYASYDEAPTAYARGDVFVSPTYSEGFSNTILEAMACGLPVVSTRSVGVVDCVVDGVTGRLHDPGDVPGLADALDHVLGDAALRRQLTETALAEVRAIWSWPALAARIQDVYAALPRRGSEEPLPALPDPDPACRFRFSPHLL